MKKFLGVFLVAAVFIFLFTLVALDVGIIYATIIYGEATLACSILLTGVWLIIE